MNWKVNFGQSYKESRHVNEIFDIAFLDNARSANYRYIRPSLTFDLRNSKVSLDYDLIVNNLTNNVNDRSTPDRTSNKNTRNTVSATYQNR